MKLRPPNLASVSCCRSLIPLAIRALSDEELHAVVAAPLPQLPTSVHNAKFRGEITAYPREYSRAAQRRRWARLELAWREALTPGSPGVQTNSRSEPWLPQPSLNPVMFSPGRITARVAPRLRVRGEAQQGWEIRVDRGHPESGADHLSLTWFEQFQGDLDAAKDRAQFLCAEVEKIIVDTPLTSSLYKPATRRSEP